MRTRFRFRLCWPSSLSPVYPDGLAPGVPPAGPARSRARDRERALRRSPLALDRAFRSQVDCRRRQRASRRVLRRDRRRAVEDQRWRRHVARRIGRFLQDLVGRCRRRLRVESDVVYAGMGEVQLRGNVIRGDGIYKSSDGGGPGRTPASRRQWSSAASTSTANPDIVRRRARRSLRAEPRNAASTRRRTAARRGRRCCRATTRRARPISRWIQEPRDPMPDAGRSSARRIRWSGGPGSGLFKQRTAATRGRS